MIIISHHKERTLRLVPLHWVDDYLRWGIKQVPNILVVYPSFSDWGNLCWSVFDDNSHRSEWFPNNNSWPYCNRTYTCKWWSHFHASYKMPSMRTQGRSYLLVGFLLVVVSILWFLQNKDFSIWYTSNTNIVLVLTPAVNLHLAFVLVVFIHCLFWNVWMPFFWLCLANAFLHRPSSRDRILSQIRATAYTIHTNSNWMLYQVLGISFRWLWQCRCNGTHVHKHSICRVLASTYPPGK